MRAFLLVCVFLCTTAAAQTRKTISRAELDDILAHSIDLLSLDSYCKTPDGFHPATGLRVVDPEEVKVSPDSMVETLRRHQRTGKTFALYNEMLHLIHRLQPRIITNAVSVWGAWDWHVHMNRCRATVADIKAADPGIIVQGAAYEFVDNLTTNGVAVIPTWVWDAFGLPDEHRYFDIRKMMFADWARQDEPDVPLRWWTYGGLKDGLPNAIVPDIRTLEAQMWFYYHGRTFIDMGCESITFSQVELMNNNSRDPKYWNIVFDKLRDYAATKPNLRYLLITGHTNGMRDADGNLAFDFHSSPIRPSELGTNVDENGGDCNITAESCNFAEGPGKIYGRSLGGRTPSGWWCDATPGVVFIDHYGPNGPPSGWGTPVGGGCNLYHFDEMTWFALQDKAYRDGWLRYAFHRVRQLDSVIHFAPIVKRGPTYRTGWYPADYFANNPVPGLLDPPATINNIPGGDVDRNRVQLYAAYGQEDVILELLSGQSTAPQPSSITVAPNPAREWVEIKLAQPNPISRASYYLINAHGIRIATGTFVGAVHRVDVSGFPRGVYGLMVWDGRNNTLTKVVLQ